MSDKDTRRDLSRELESLKDTLTYEKPAQIPLLDDVVDEESLKPEPGPRKRHKTKDKSPPPDTRDLFDSQPNSPDAAKNAESNGQEKLREEVNRVAEEYLQEKADKLAHAWLREQADKMVEELVDEYSTEILKRLKTKLTSQLYAILEDLDTKNDTDENQNKS